LTCSSRIGWNENGDIVTHKEELGNLSRIEGQVRGIKQMIKNERYCVDILMQIKSIMSALDSVKSNIMKKHIDYCVANAIRSGDIAKA